MVHEKPVHGSATAFKEKIRDGNGKTEYDQDDDYAAGASFRQRPFHGLRVGFEMGVYRLLGFGQVESARRLGQGDGFNPVALSKSGNGVFRYGGIGVGHAVN